MLKTLLIGGFVGCLAALAFSSCSLEAPKPGSGVKIVIEDQGVGKSQSITAGSLLESFSSAGYVVMAGGPSASTDFSCFAVNITGDGITSQSKKLENCTSTTNMQGTGVGILVGPQARGVPLEVDIPSGPSRTVDVYGVFPPSNECGGATGSSGGSGSNSGGYFLGRVQQAIAKETTVTVPIAYSGAAVDITCKDNGGNGGGGGGGGPFISSPFPYTGRAAGGWTFQVNGGGLLSSATVSISDGTNTYVCTSQTFVSSNQISCTLPTSMVAGNYNVIVSQNSQTFQTPSAFFQLRSPSNSAVSVDKNTNNLAFGNVANGSTSDQTITFANEGDLAASLGGTPTVPAPFSIVGGTCVYDGSHNIAASGGSCTVIVRFAPTGTGPFSTGAVNLGVTNFSNFTGTGI